MATSIPPRSSSRYSGQYAGAFDPLRILEIFTDSLKIALSSKNPDTAASRFELAIEAYHQLLSMPVPPETRALVQDGMARLTESFATQVLVNEAVGLSEKAAKLKTPRKRLELLQQAHSVIERGLLKDPQNPLLQGVAEKLRTEMEGVAG